MKIKISADSTCDLSPELIDQYDIGIISLGIIMSGKSYRDGIDINPDMIFDHVSAGGEICSTSAVNVSDYTGIFEEYLESFDAVIHFNISSNMSSCYQNAVIAASELQNVYVIDSRNLSTGIGQLVLDAAVMAKNGMDAADIASVLDDKQARLDVSFVLDTLEYLKKGGRCSALAALGANLLSLHPCIEVKDGKMCVGKKYRGTTEKCISKYIAERLSDKDSIDHSRIFVTNSGGFSRETLDSIKALVNEYGPFDEILETRAGCTISSHCGPRCFGILYYRNK